MGKKGFTIIEISLFLAITGLLFFGVTIGVQTSISNQRNNDSVQSFVEFLRTAYSEVSNVQNINGGKSDWALYGKLITFGENNQDTIYSYDVLGKADASTTSQGALNALADLKSDVVMKENDQIRLVGIPGSYTPKWGASIEKSCSDNSCSYERFTGALLIVRHPKSGTIYTYINQDQFNINQTYGSNYNTDVTDKDKGEKNIENIDSGVLFSKQGVENYGFEIKQVDFCINPDPGNETKNRRDVRIIKNARNSSGIEIIPDDQSRCRRNL